MKKPENLVLVGFMGTGKTTVGKIVAHRLGLAFVDSDDEIARRAGRSVQDIFAARGEAAFRELEERVIRDLADRSGLLIATGGGAVLNPTNFSNLKQSGVVVALTATTDILWDRLRETGTRPLLAVDDPQAALRQLFATRAPLYSQAEYVIDTSSLGVEEAATQVCAAFSLSRAETVRVDLGERSYDTVIGGGTLEALGLAARRVSQAGKAILVTNETVAALYANRALASLGRAGFEVTVVALADGEEFKRLSSVERLYDAAVESRLARDGLVVALGGGVVGDTAGFFAATYMRGVSLLQVPTTLLAQVDASVGGKVGVNHPRGKNLIGAFHQPVAVLADTALLSSLPSREFHAGLAEVVKTAVIGDPELFSLLEGSDLTQMARDAETLTQVVARCCRVKAGIVCRDEREGSVRAILNLGHTVGHAIEAATGFRSYLHGEAVSMGLLTATLLAARDGLCRPDLVARIRDLLARFGLPLAPDGVAPAEIVSHLGRDKKSRQGQVRWVLPRAIGEVTVNHEVRDGDVLACLEEQSRWLGKGGLRT